MNKFSIIVAVDSKNGIWKSWDLAWYIPSDLKFFKETTLKVKSEWSINAVIMWRNTWESIPERFKPLSWRLNIVLSSKKNLGLNDEVITCNSLEEALQIQDLKIENYFVIGWWRLYSESINSQYLDKIYITEIYWDFVCDTFFPVIDITKFSKTKEWVWQEENWIKFRFCEYQKINN